MNSQYSTAPALDACRSEQGERLSAEMAAAWARGERLPAEHYLDHHPELLERPQEAVRLVYEEVCLRLERGEGVTREELARRFPRWASELAVMLDCDRLVQAHLAPPLFPALGEVLGGFRLIDELGRGIHGRVFLAAQPTLADRLVVLKVTPRQDREYLSLARLQHTHIIPLHGVHDFPARNLHALCQPYLGGGATLGRLLDLLRPTPAARRTGRALVDALDHAGKDNPLPFAPRGPREALAKATYPEAICWVGACLAEALQHAHERGLVHLDLKPSNVLLAADAQPMLLDFHLALHPVPAGQPAPEGLGGTPEYMSPEQQAAFAAAHCGTPVPADVDGRSDVYSLGRLLYVALGGKAWCEGGNWPSLHRCNPQVSVGLADIVGRCQAPLPADRYASAGALAADLRRHLAGLPLRGAPNRSLRERWRKWRRRRPYALLWAGALLALAAGTAASGAAVLERLTNAREALHEGQELVRRHSFAEAARALTRGRSQAASLPGCRGLVEQFDDCLLQTRRACAVEQFHVVTERLRLVAGGDALPEQELRTLEAHCRTTWEARRLLADPPGESLQDQARVDLIDLALLWTDLKRRLGPDDQESRVASQRVLDEVEALCGPSDAVAFERRTLSGAALVEARQSRRSFQESAALGRSLLRAGKLERAAEELERAVELRPQDFWSHFYRGVCASRRGRHADAVHSFGVAVALVPQFAEAYHNRALALAAGRDVSAALRDYDRALALRPTLAAAALNRGVLYCELGRYAESLADLKRAQQNGADPATIAYNMALVHLAQGERSAARASAAQALRHDPTHRPAQRLRDHLGNDR